MKKFFNTLVLLVAILLIIPANIYAETPAKANVANKYGNTLGNIVNHGLAAKQGSYIYYVNYRNDNMIYKIKTDLSGKVKLNNDPSSSLGVIGDWIYYSNGNDKYRVYRMKTDGSSKKRLSDDQYADQISIVGDWIYYTAGPETARRLYKMKIDGSAKKQMTKGYTDSINVTADWIYFREGSSLCKMKTDGSGKVQLFKSFMDNINVVGDWIYFTNFDDRQKLYKIKKDGTGKKVLYKDKTYRVNAAGDWIYFLTANGISRIKADGSGLKEIWKGQGIEAILTIDDLVYFIQEDNGVVFYRMKSDGTNIERLDGLKAQTSAAPDKLNGEVNRYGNTNGNISNNGLAAIQGGMIYYTKQMSGSKVLCKEKTDGSGSVVFSLVDAAYINVAGDWIYYSGSRGSLYKMQTGGTQITQLTEDYDYATDIHLAGDWIYYKSNQLIYRIKNDGSGKKKLCDDTVYESINISGDWIYYVSDGDGKLYKLKMDGSKKEKVLDFDPGSFTVDGDWIYFKNIYDRYRIYRQKADGTEKQKVLSDNIGILNVSNDWIFYTNPDDGFKLYKVKTDGTGRVKINNRKTYEVNVAGDWIFYKDSASSVPYRMKLDGSAEQKLE